jgi:hypothetical protein
MTPGVKARGAGEDQKDGETLCAKRSGYQNDRRTHQCPRGARMALRRSDGNHYYATFRKMKFVASIVTTNAKNTGPSTALRR